MIESSIDNLITIMDENLKQLSFEKYLIEDKSSKFYKSHVWRRKTWNTNRAVALIPFSKTGKNTGKYAKNIKSILGKEIGYKLFFYPLGLQIILYGNNIYKKTEELNKYVDKIDTQTVVLQSIFVVDLKSKKYKATRTWGQYTTGKFQDAIEKSITQFLE
jgi:hypothetical protein